MRGLQDLVVVITGGGRGIGRAIAEKFAEYGSVVVVGSRSLSEVENAAAEINANGGRTFGYALDVANRESVAHFTEQVWTNHQHIDVLVNCAGVNTRLPAETFPEDDWERILNINITGVYRASQEIGRRMIEQGSGAIVNITSMTSHTVTPNLSAYAASKGALLQYTKSLAVEWAKYNIRVNAVSPGYIETAMTSAILQQPVYQKSILDKTPQQRFGKPEEIAEAVCFLASPAASFITGVALPVDGGFQAGHPQIVPPVHHS
jgi:NAD(P)-dependent dehydrogenase (short-subunit alcohol dehydrogenase family)